MFNKNFLVPLLGMASLFFSMPSYSENPYFYVTINVNTVQSISGEPLKITSLKLYPPAIGKQPSPQEVQIFMPGNPSSSIPLADIVVAPNASSTHYCLIHVIAGPLYFAPDIQLQADSTQCSTGVIFATSQLNPNGNCQWPPNACYQINFYTVTKKE